MLKEVLYLILAFFKPNAADFEKLGRTVEFLSKAVEISKGDDERRLGQLAYFLRHAVEAHWGAGKAEMPYWTRWKLLLFTTSPLWKGAEEKIKTAKYSTFNKISSKNKEPFAEIMQCLIGLGEIFIYSSKHKDSNLFKVLTAIKGQYATA